MTKSELYRAVSTFRKRHNLRVTRETNCIQEFCENTLGLYVEYHNFKTPGLRGAAFIDNGVIALSSSLSEEQRKFYCSHEMIHFYLHPDENKSAFQCYDANNILYQNDIVEWEANEGAAEVIIPHFPFIEAVVNEAPYIKNGRDFLSLRRSLVSHFNVTPTMIKTRFECLKYELAQALAGVPINEVVILSDKQQKASGIEVISLNKIYPDMFVKYPLTEYENTMSLLDCNN